MFRAWPGGRRRCAQNSDIFVARGLRGRPQRRRPDATTMGDAFKLTREGTPEQAVHTTDCASAYLDLLKLVLTRSFVDEEFVPLQPTHGLKRAAFSLIRPIIERAGVEFVRRRKLDHDVRSAGHDWPSDAETMIGVERLDNLDTLIRDVIENDVPG